MPNLQAPWGCALCSLALLGGLSVHVSASRIEAAEMHVPVTFSGGHEIGKQDFGRPVELIAAALNVKPEVFRAAFSGVTPARGRGPTGGEARKNKAALLSVLGKHGVTNERLDEVSDHYRFRPDRGERWPTTDAKAYAVVSDGKIQKFVVTAAGAGYSSNPTVAVAGFPGLTVKVTRGFHTDFRQNGRIATIELLSQELPPAN